MEQTSPLILLVEDNAEIGPFVQLELESEGYRVELATDGQTGLMKFRQLEPDLLILDWELPRMSGVEVCRRVRQSSHVPVLMLTAKKEIHDRVEGLDAGANDYLIKPFELDELLARVRAQLRSRQKPDLTRLIFLIPALFLLQLLNVVRFVLLALYWKDSWLSRYTGHHAVFNTIIYAILLLLANWWIRRYYFE